MMNKPPFKFIRKWSEVVKHPDGSEESIHRCEYEAGFWEGPTEPGDTGRYVRCKTKDTFMDGRFLNTSPSVSYYGQLMKAFGGK